MGGFHCVRYGVTGDSSGVIARDKSSKMPFFKSPWRFLMIVLSSSPHPTRGPLYSQLLFFSSCCYFLCLSFMLSFFVVLFCVLLFVFGFFFLQCYLYLYFPHHFKDFLRITLKPETFSHLKEVVRSRAIMSRNIFSARESLLHKLHRFCNAELPKTEQHFKQLKFTKTYDYQEYFL